ncbi:hypothetical protein GDO81_014426 [Engystomops pustulosus]|uniref:Coiled-coil domain containing 84 n=1 Tax=Engystomops pustulosus TaxID=76066 RepID=A0AAV7BA56_ENGPU|nr:hypothetical protein GDO81_014426 [Engystomops pustulosus]
MVVYECAVCRRTVFSGRRKHVYEKGHQQKLAGVLRAFGDKVAAARKMIKGAAVVRYDPLEHEQKFWCYCCEEEVIKHTSDGDITVMYGGMLQHLCRPEHIKAVSKYWWTHQAEGKLKPQFILTQADYERFKSSVTKALDNYEETENVLIKQIASQIRETEESRMEMLKAVLEVCFKKAREQYPYQTRSGYITSDMSSVRVIGLLLQSCVSQLQVVIS